MSYIEAFVAPVPDANRTAYCDHANRMAAFFKSQGATKIVECWGTNVPDGMSTSLPKAVQLEEGESIVLGWISWPDRETRDAAFATMRSGDGPAMGPMPFDGKRIIFGGFEPIIEL